ncbi:hypothetical protein EVAR_16324_1 [Eumeta japonica]|uniref:Uncharacterized protein n=1 Tax=Eumeta variegata TaxID=151549 RepID=A0A4C1VFK3_EUMVA|nr:hypothetical protein EVAR_16324_1 [Eumeta japonica]
MSVTSCQEVFSPCESDAPRAPRRTDCSQRVFALLPYRKERTKKNGSHLHYHSKIFSLQCTIVHLIRIGISEVKLCASINVPRYYFDDLSWRGADPANGHPISTKQKRAIKRSTCVRPVRHR